MNKANVRFPYWMFKQYAIMVIKALKFFKANHSMQHYVYFADVADQPFKTAEPTLLNNVSEASALHQQ